MYIFVCWVLIEPFYLCWRTIFYHVPRVSNVEADAVAKSAVSLLNMSSDHEWMNLFDKKK